MNNLKLFVWRDGNEIYDYEATAIVLANTLDEALTLLRDLYDPIYKKLSSVKPEVLPNAPTALIAKQYAICPKCKLNEYGWEG